MKHFSITYDEAYYDVPDNKLTPEHYETLLRWWKNYYGFTGGDYTPGPGVEPEPVASHEGDTDGDI